MFQHQLELLPTFLFPQVVSWFAVFPDNVCDSYTLLWITRVEASVSFVCFSINQASRLSVKHSLAHGPHPKHNSYWRSKQRTHNQTQGVCAANLCAHTHTLVSDAEWITCCHSFCFTISAHCEDAVKSKNVKFKQAGGGIYATLWIIRDTRIQRLEHGSVCKRLSVAVNGA